MPCGVIPSIPLSFSLVTILPHEPKGLDFSISNGGRAVKRIVKNPNSVPAWFTVIGLQGYQIVFAPHTLILD